MICVTLSLCKHQCVFSLSFFFKVLKNKLSTIFRVVIVVYFPHFLLKLFLYNVFCSGLSFPWLLLSPPCFLTHLSPCSPYSLLLLSFSNLWLLLPSLSRDPTINCPIGLGVPIRIYPPPKHPYWWDSQIHIHCPTIILYFSSLPDEGSIVILKIFINLTTG